MFLSEQWPLSLLQQTLHRQGVVAWLVEQLPKEFWLFHGNESPFLGANGLHGTWQAISSSGAIPPGLAGTISWGGLRHMCAPQLLGTTSEPPVTSIPQIFNLSLLQNTFLRPWYLQQSEHTLITRPCYNVWQHIQSRGRRWFPFIDIQQIQRGVFLFHREYII